MESTTTVRPVVTAASMTRTLPAAFSRLVWSNLAAQLAEQVSLAAAPIVAVLVLGAGAGGTGLLQAAQTLPFLLLSIPAGILADRASRHRLMAIAETIRMLSLAAILILSYADLLTLPLLGILGFLGATGTVVYGVCAPALTPALVSRDLLAMANRRLEVIRSIAYVSGPALGGAVVGWLGGSPAFAMATALSGVAVVLLSGIREPQRTERVARKPIIELQEGVAFLFTHAILRPLFMTAVFFNVAYFVLMGIYVPYAHDELGLSATVIGVTLAIYGVGMIVGALVSGFVMQRFPFGVVLCIGPMMGLAAILVMATTIIVTGPVVSPILAGLSFLLIGMGPMIWTISSTTLRQTVTPDVMLGRVSSVIMTATFGARPLGAAIGALIGSMISLPACILVAIIGFAIQAVIIVRSAPARLIDLPPHVS